MSLHRELAQGANPAEKLTWKNKLFFKWITSSARSQHMANKQQQNREKAEVQVWNWATNNEDARAGKHQTSHKAVKRLTTGSFAWFDMSLLLSYITDFNYLM